MSRRIRFVTTNAFVIVIVALTTCTAVAQTESVNIERTRKLIESEKETILFFAHPTATYQSHRYDGSKQLRDGFSVTYTFNWHSNISDKDHYTELTFHCDRNGKLDSIENISTSSLFKPFFGSNSVVSLIKREMQKDPELQKNSELMMLLKKDSKQILETYLRRDVKALMTILGSTFGAANEADATPLQQPQQATVRKPVIPDATPNQAELLGLIRKSESMDEKERKYWTNMLPRMTADQKGELRAILVNERDQLAAIDQKYRTESGPVAEARALLKKNKYEDAISVLAKTLTAEPKNSDALSLRATAYHSIKQWRLAIDDYTALIDILPKSESTYRNRASCYAALGDYRRQLFDHMRSVELAPKDARACNGAAWLLATCPDQKIRDGSEALQLATRACEVTDWKDPLYLDTLAAAYAELGQFEKAVEWQQKALANPDFEKNVDKDEFVVAQRRLNLYKSGKPFREK